MPTLNLGVVKALHVGLTPPANLNLLWKDTNATPAIMKEFDGFVWNSLASTATAGRPNVRGVFDESATALPLVTTTPIDGLTVADSDRFLVLDSSIAGEINKIHKATVVSTTITWAVEQDGTGADLPTSGQLIWSESGTVFSSISWRFDGSTWTFGGIGTSLQEWNIGYNSDDTGIKLKISGTELQVRNQLDTDFLDLRVKNLTVEGTTTTINSEIVTIADNIILLNSNVTGSPSEDGGIELERGSSTNASLIWDETADFWKAGLLGSEDQIVLKSDADADYWILDTTPGDVSAIQNTVISDLVNQDTGALTFDGINWDITTVGRGATGDINFLNFFKDSGQVFELDIDGIITTPDIDFGSGVNPSLRIGRVTSISVNFSTIVGNNSTGSGNAQTGFGESIDLGSTARTTGVGRAITNTGITAGSAFVGTNLIYAHTQPGILMGDGITAPTNGSKGSIMFNQVSTITDLGNLITMGSTQTINNSDQAGVEVDGGVYIGHILLAGGARGTQIGNITQNEGISNCVYGYGAKLLRGSAGDITHSIAIGRGAYLKSEFINTGIVLGNSDSMEDLYINNGWTHRFKDNNTENIVTRTPSSHEAIYHGLDAYDDVDGTSVDISAGAAVVQGGLATGTGTSGNVILRVGDNVDIGGNVKNATIDGLIVSSGGAVSIPNGNLSITGNIIVSGTVDGINIATDVAANTAKVSNVTHTGDVTGSEALTIATDAVDISMLSATGTPDGTTFLRGDNTWAIPASGGSSAGADNEVQTSDGAGAFIASNLFFDEASGIMTLGDSGLAGDRVINIASSATNASLTLESKGTGALKILNTTNNHTLTIGDGASATSTIINLLGDQAAPTTLNASNGGIGGTKIKAETSGTGDAYFLAGVTGRFYSIGIDNTASDLLKITTNTTEVSTNPSSGTEVLAISTGGGIGLFATTPVTQASAMTAATATVTNGTIGNADTIIDNLVIRVNELEAMLDASTGIGVAA